MWLRVREQHRGTIERTTANGHPGRLLFPHPDDMVFDAERLVIFRGPLSMADQNDCLHIGRIRDALVYQFVLDAVPDGNRRLQRSRTDPGRLALVLHLDNVLPPRVQQGTDGGRAMIASLFTETKRALLKATVAAWKRTGSPRARGQRITNRDAATVLQFCRQTILQLDAGASDEQVTATEVRGIICYALHELAASLRRQPTDRQLVEY